MLAGAARLDEFDELRLGEMDAYDITHQILSLCRGAPRQRLPGWAGRTPPRPLQRVRLGGVAGAGPGGRRT
jgi:hypothetical protein